MGCTCSPSRISFHSPARRMAQMRGKRGVDRCLMTAYSRLTLHLMSSMCRYATYTAHKDTNRQACAVIQHTRHTKIPTVKHVPLYNIHGTHRYPTKPMSIAALQKLLHILWNKMTAQFCMSVRSEQDGCRSYVPSICSCQNTNHAQIGIAIPDVELSSFDWFIFLFSDF